MGLELYYNEVALHTLGEVSVRRQTDEYAATDLPQQKVVKLQVRLDFFQQNWADNYQLIETLRLALKSPHTRLRWLNENGQEVLNQAVTLNTNDLPEEPNAWGTRQQQANFEFSYVVHDLLTNALTATVTSGGDLVLGRVLAYEEALAITRYDELHAHRRRSAYQITMSGILPGNMALDLEDRRTALLAAKSVLIAKVDKKEIRLAYGDFDRMVRVSNFKAVINQAVREIEWSLTAEFNLFPDETDYALGEYQVILRDEGADQILGILGRIQASSKDRAQTKLASIVATVLGSYGFSADRIVREETGANHAISGADGDTFLELPFSREYRKPLANVMTFTKAGGTSPVTLGNITGQADAYAAERYHKMRDQRSHAERRIRFTGQYFADATQTLETRKSQLKAVKAAWLAEVNSKRGVLVYGDFSQTVRVTALEAEADHAVRVLVWTMTVEFTVFPDEANYATVEFSTGVRDEGADQFLTFTGRIQAQDEAKARTKLASLRTGVLAGRGFSKALVVREESVPAQVEADADGTAFLELTFTEEYRLPLANVMTFTREGGGEAIPFGNVISQRDGYAAERYHTMRDQRSRASRTVTFAGQYFTDATKDLETRKAELKDQRDLWLAEVNSKRGVLVYGDFSQTVRVTALEAEADHAVRVLVWTMTVEFTVFPDEANYATVEFTANTRDEGADQFLTFTGRIQAQDEAKARTKLASLRNTVLSGSGYSRSLVVREDTSPARVEADADGEAFLELSFTEEYRKPLENALTYQRAGGGTVTLANVTQFKHDYQAQRYSNLRSERSYAGGNIAAQGVYYADATKPLADRRAELQAVEASWRAEFNSKQGTLVHGDFNRVVRVTEFEAELDPAVRSLAWTLAAEYTVFPNEAGYTLVQYTLTTREDKETGQVTLLFSGRIGANNLTAAQNKLNTLRTAVLGSQSYTQKKKESKPEHAEGDADGSVFLELGFDEEYELGTADLVRWQMNVTSADDVATGTVRQTWAGSVTSRGADFATAEAKAKAQARLLGDNKAQFKKAESITVEDRQTMTTGERLVTVNFSFEYQARGLKIFIEISAEVNRETFGESTEQVSGFIAAPSMATATNTLNSGILTAYAGRLIKGKRTTERYERTNRITLANGTIETPLEEQFIRLEFGFNVYKDKEANETAMQYELDVSVDDASNTRTVTLSGTVWAKDEETDEAGGLVRPSGKRTKAEKVLNDFLNGMADWLGQRQRINVREGVDLFLGQTNNLTDDIRQAKGLAFTVTYEKALTSAEQILQCQLNERVEHSGIRWVAQGIPDGRTVMQNCGIKEGRRTVRGSVTATTLQAAITWAKAQRSLLQGTYEDPPAFDTTWEFPAKTSGITSGSTANAKLHRVDFQYSETLPDHDYVV